MAAGDEVRAPRQTSERAAREALKASTLRGFELCLRRRGLICHALKSAALKEGLSFILPPSRGGTPSLKTTSRHLSDHETRLPRERLHLRLSPVGAPGGGPSGTSRAATGPPLSVCTGRGSAGTRAKRKVDNERGRLGE